jgi:glycosyltransferase involved in cell wall biosynthesis
MKSPVLSIVVPTCDRPDTLVACLRALAKQPNPAIEIIVQDNASGPETTAVINSIGDKRIVHKRLDERVSMRQNFEEGVAAATGDYISLIGDDDAFCAGAFDWMVAILEEQRPDALRWRLATYYWPSLSEANIGFFSLHYTYFYGGWQWRENAEATAKLLAGTMDGLWQSLQIYHGAVSRTLYESTKANLGGVFFGYHIPDIYVHTAMLLTTTDKLTGRHIDVDHPLSIYGVSGHSNGSSWYAASGDKRGAASPMAQWTKTAKEDTQVDYTVLTPIRSMKFHDYVVLMMLQEKGLVEKDKIDHEHWLQTIFDEAAANPWQLRGFKEAVPVRDYEKQVVKAVLDRFATLADNPPSEPGRLKTLYPQCWRWQQLCPVSIFPDRADNIDTAVDVLDAVVIQEMGLAEKSPVTAVIADAMRDHLRLRLHQAYEAHPPVLP